MSVSPLLTWYLVRCEDFAVVLIGTHIVIALRSLHLVAAPEWKVELANSATSAVAVTFTLNS